MKNKYEPQNITIEIRKHLKKEFMRYITVKDAITTWDNLFALVTPDVLERILLEVEKVIKNFQPTKTQIEILENMGKKEGCVLIKFNQNPLEMSVEELKELTGNKLAYGLFGEEIYFLGNDFKVHALNLIKEEDINDYLNLKSLFSFDLKEAKPDELEYILSYTGHAPNENNKFTYNVAGNFILQPGKNHFDLSTGIGLEPTGLCKLFFNALNVSPTLYFQCTNTTFWRREEGIDFSFWSNLNSATTNTLKPTQTYRAKQILLHFCQVLAKHATPLQLVALIKELKEESNDSITQLCEPRGINGFFKSIRLYSSSIKTDSYSSYETFLLSLFHNNIGCPSFIKKLVIPELPKDTVVPEELYQFIASMLNKTDYSSLSCVNREFSKEMNKVIEESRPVLGRKF